jgi:hypothetical protein
MKLIAVLGEDDYAYELFVEHCSDRLSELWDIAHIQPNHKYYFEVEDEFNSCCFSIEAVEFLVSNSFFEWISASGLLEHEHVGLVKVSDDNIIHPRG